MSAGHAANTIEMRHDRDHFNDTYCLQILTEGSIPRRKNNFFLNLPFLGSCMSTPEKLNLPLQSGVLVHCPL